MKANYITIVDNTAAFRARLYQRWQANPFDVSLIRKLILSGVNAPKGKS